MFAVYLAYSGFRLRNAGPAGNNAREFIARRTPLDIAAMRARVRLIADADFRRCCGAGGLPCLSAGGSDRSDCRNLAGLAVAKEALPRFQRTSHHLAGGPYRVGDGARLESLNRMANGKIITGGRKFL